jgi:hypothetical protein
MHNNPTHDDPDGVFLDNGVFPSLLFSSFPIITEVWTNGSRRCERTVSLCEMRVPLFYARRDAILMHFTLLLTELCTLGVFFTVEFFRL